MYCLSSCSQTQDIAGEYEKLSTSGSVQHLLKLHPDGTFHFDSYSIKQIEGKISLKENLTTEPSMSGRGTWSAKNDIIYFRTDRVSDIDYNNTLNFNATKAKIKNESSKKSDLENPITKLEFFESNIFWINGIDFIKRN